MKYARFRDPSGAIRRGVYHDGTVTFGDREYAIDEVSLLAPCEPTKIVCIGRNYAKHAEEFGNAVPDRPLLFLKPPNTVAGHGDTVTAPAGTERLDVEAELGVVIGEQCRNVLADDAMGVVAGFTCVNDLSNRDDQRREQNWVRGKAFDGAAPMGPVLATPEELPHGATVRGAIDGETVQEAPIDAMIFSIPELIAEITRYLTLEPGDVIATGTPDGVTALEDGDRVEITVEGIGTLEHSVEWP